MMTTEGVDPNGNHSDSAWAEEQRFHAALEKRLNEAASRMEDGRLSRDHRRGITQDHFRENMDSLQPCSVMHPDEDFHVDGCQGMAQLRAAIRFYGVDDEVNRYAWKDANFITHYGSIPEGEDYHLETDPVKRTQKKYELFKKLYGGDNPHPLAEVADKKEEKED